LLGAHSTTERAKDDFYQSSTEIANALFECVKVGIKRNDLYAEGLEETVIIDSSVGTGTLLEPFRYKCWSLIGYDIADRGYKFVSVQDWLTVKEIPNPRNKPKVIVQNPPFKLALEFVQHSLELLNNGELLFSLHRIQFLEGLERFENLYKNKYKRPKYVFVFTKRVSCITPDIENKGKNAVCFAWFMWQKGYRGSTQIKWIVDGEIR
jgi:hypothetical protein